MALRPTIHKFEIDLSDLDRDHYETLSLTVARHPSETMERMVARVLAMCLNAGKGLEFCKGLSDADEADLWAHSLDGQCELWVDVGEPEPKRVKKATRIARQVLIYSFNTKSDVWWQREGAEIARYGAAVWRFDADQIEALAARVERTQRLGMTITGESAWVAVGDESLEVSWTQLAGN